jgi:hypothetical protein
MYSAEQNHHYHFHFGFHQRFSISSSYHFYFLISYFSETKFDLSGISVTVHQLSPFGLSANGLECKHGRGFLFLSFFRSG